MTYNRKKVGSSLIRRASVVVCVLAVVSLATRSEAATRTVCAAGCAYTDLQAAIDAAAYGDTILLRAGQTLIGHYTLRVKSGSGVIIIRSDAPDSSLPPAGTRLVPATRGGPVALSQLARIIGRGGAYKSAPLLRTEPGAHGYVIRFIEFDGVSHLGYETLIQIGEDTTSQPPYDITLDRVYIHGDRYKGQKRGITLNGNQVSVLNSYISDIKAVNADSQAINGYNGAGPFTIENNYLEAAGENVLFGGADPAVANLVPSDIVMRRNHLFKPLAWRNAILAPPASPRATAGSGGALASGTHYFRVVALMATGTRTANSAPSVEVSATVSSGGSVDRVVVEGGGRGQVPCLSGHGCRRADEISSTPPRSSSDLHGRGRSRPGHRQSSGTKWVVKNTFELKNAQRVTFEGNVHRELLVGGAVRLRDRAHAAQQRRGAMDPRAGHHLHQQHRPSRRRRAEPRRVRRLRSDPGAPSASPSATICSTT